MSESNTKYDAVVLGSGVLGLSIADELTQKGIKVAIVARELPEDVHSSQFASPWAGANWASYASTPAEQQRDIITFKRFEQLAQDHPDLVRRTPLVYAFDEDGAYDPPWYKDVVYDFRALSGDDIPKGWQHAFGFSAYTLNPPRYLAHLAKKLRDAGVPIIRQRVSSLDEAYDIPSVGPVDLVVNCTGLGARSLLGVEDPAVFPARGQTVTVYAPHVRGCFAAKDKNRVQSTGVQTYIIPRPGPEGHVTLGGTFVRDDYSTLPDPAVAERILKETYDLCPALGDGKGWENIKIVSHNVGLRPARDGGMRLELEKRTLGTRGAIVPGQSEGREARDVAVVHAYGIGAAGYQASLGIAEEATGLVLGHLGK